jgi:chromosome partitioning protein
MSIHEERGISQSCMSQMIGAAASKISRHVFASNVQSLPGYTSKRSRYSIESTRMVLSELFRNSLEVDKKVHCFYNFKGGTGKTSLCFQVSSQLALLGFNVLVVDADPQAHLTASLGINRSRSYMTLFDVLDGKADAKDVVVNIHPGLDCIPSHISLTRAEVLLSQMTKREERVKTALQPLESTYDFIIFDMNPNISLLNRNILVYSSLINIICETQPYSLDGLKILMEDMNRFFKDMQMTMPETMITPNKYEDRTATSGEAMTLLRDYYSRYIKPDFAIRKSEDINISAKNRLPLPFFARSNSLAFSDTIELVQYIIEKTCTNRDELENLSLKRKSNTR